MLAGANRFDELASRWLARSDRQPIHAVDSHTGGNPTRIVLSGINAPAGVTTVDATRAWLRDHADQWRRRLVHEPRGGGLTCAVVPVATREDGCDIGAVILEPGSYPPMCGHCMIGFASVIVDLDLLPGLWADDPELARFRIRTPAGPIGIEARRSSGGVVDITMSNVASFAVRKDVVALDGAKVDVELLYGGDYYITVDADRIGLSLDRDNATEIVRIARALKSAYTANGVVDLLTGAALDVYQVMFFRHDGHVKERAQVVVVAPPGVIDRSPCGTGSSALLAKLVTDGSLAPGQILTTTSIIGSTFTAVTPDARSEGGRTYIRPFLSGQAYINGFLTIAVDDRDALADGFAPL